jgi:mannose-6-phosphate isomerase
VIPVDGVLRPYPWGRIDGLAAWHGATGGPQAELWYGALGDGPEAPRHPLLTKLLAAANPLSIQVHPPAALVDRLWDDEAHGRALLADRVEKTELLLALEPFTAFAGFREPAQCARILDGLGLHDSAAIAAGDDHVATIQSLLSLSQMAVDEAFRRLSDVIHLLLPATERSAIELVRAWYPHDRGALVALCLTVHELAPGDAIHVPAGVVHCYVNGLGVEVMTASDNVLRLGLTAKQLAVPEALAAVSSVAPTVVRATPDHGAALYFADGSPFLVARLQGPGSSWTIPPHLAATVLAVEGEATVTTIGGARTLSAGRAVLVTPFDGGADVSSDGLAVIAVANP